MVSDLIKRIKDAMPFWGFPAIVTLVIVMVLVVIMVASAGGHKSTNSA